MRPLAVIGNVNVDLIMGPAAPWPQPGTEIIVDHDELRVGGSAGNAALAVGEGAREALAPAPGLAEVGIVALLPTGFGCRRGGGPPSGPSPRP